MVRLIRLLLLFVLLNQVAHATTYYVSAAGNDSNNGTSTATSWQTITKVNTMMNTFAPGDQILFKRGDLFYGMLDVKSSGNATSTLLFSAYGSGNKPILTGLQTLTGWTAVSGYTNVWQATLPSAKTSLNILLQNGVQRAWGRWPNYNTTNGGYRIINNTAGDSTIVDAATIANNFVGGEAVVNSPMYQINRYTIKSYSGSTFILNPNAAAGHIWYQRGYFVQNHIKTLDIEGEWAFDASTNKVYLYTATNPSSQNIQVSMLDYNLNSQYNYFYHTFRNLSFIGANVENMQLQITGNVTVDSCEIAYSPAATGIYKANNSVFQNNYIHDCTNMGISIIADNTSINNNTIKRIGLYPGMGASGDNTYIGIRSVQDVSGGIVIKNNLVDSIGYHGSSSGGNTFNVSNNVFSNTGMSLADGAAIYFNDPNSGSQPASNRRVTKNICFNNYGNTMGNTYVTGATYGTKQGSFAGIYLDVSTNGMLVDSNVVYNSWSGIHLNNNANGNTITNNIFFNNAGSSIWGTSYGTHIASNAVNHNVAYSRDSLNVPLFYFTTDAGTADICRFGTFQSNYFFMPFKNTGLFNTYETSPVYNGSLTYANYKSRYHLDSTSLMSQLSYTAGTNAATKVFFFPNSTNSTTTQSLPAAYYLSEKGDTVKNLTASNVSIAPYSARIFSKIADIPTVTVTAKLSLCAGATLDTFKTTITNGGTSPTYQWYKNRTAIAGATGATYITSTLSNGDSLYVILTSGIATATSNKVAITVYPVPTVTISGLSSFCSGTNTILNAGTGYASYKWSTSAVTQTITVTSAATYKVTVTNANGCSASASKALTVTTAVTPTITIHTSATTINCGASVTFTTTTTNPGTTPTYQWSIKSTTVTGATAASYTSTTFHNNDTVTCQMVSNATCATPTTVKSGKVVMTVNGGCPASKISNNLVEIESSPLHIYPNPASSILNCEIATEGELQIVDGIGQPVITQHLNNPQTQINISQLAAGVYFYTFQSQGQVFRGKVVKE